MTREILFKAKRKDNNEWVKGSLLILESGYYIVPIGTYYNIMFDGAIKVNLNCIWEEQDFFEVIPSTICEYTGLNDKNGEMIFENDIVFYSDFASVYKDDITGVIKYTQNCKFEIEYDDKYIKGEKTTRPLVCHEHPIFTEKKIEVIGNKFDEGDNNE